MGKASQAPFSTQAPLAVSDHALDRFRERAATFLKNDGALDNRSVTYRLAWIVKHALDAGAMEKLYDVVERRAFRLVDISDEAYGRAFALVADPDPVIVTVLSIEMVEMNWSNRWQRPDGSKRGMTTLGSLIGAKLPKLTPTPATSPSQPVTPVPTPRPTPPMGVAPPVAAAPPVASAYERLVEVYWPDGSKPSDFTRATSPAVVQGLLVAAAANPVCKTRVWKLTNVRLVVSLEES